MEKINVTSTPSTVTKNKIEKKGGGGAIRDTDSKPEKSDSRNNRMW